MWRVIRHMALQRKKRESAGKQGKFFRRMPQILAVFTSVADLISFVYSKFHIPSSPYVYTSAWNVD